MLAQVQWLKLGLLIAEVKGKMKEKLSLKLNLYELNLNRKSNRVGWMGQGLDGYANFTKKKQKKIK